MSIPLSFPFDPTYGYDLDALLQVTPPDTEPADFADFWRRLHREAMAVPLEIEIGPEEPIDLPNARLRKVFFSILGGFRVGAWVMTPENLDAVRFGMVMGHGYGGREAPEPGLFRENRIVIFPLAPGFHISAVPERLSTNDPARHVVTGIESKENYILGPCAAQIWRCIDVLEALFPGVCEKFHYKGWSFGGGMGALMLPWEKRFMSAELGQPTFGNHPIRLQCPGRGSGEAVRLYHKDHPEIESVLAYFDSATAAKYIGVPVVFGLSIYDPAVPPPGQFAVANAVTAPKRISCFSVGHVDYEPPEKPAEEERHVRHLIELIEAERPLSFQ